MTNWFEANPTKSVITYTLLIVGTTWATSTFILQDNRLNLAKSELESQQTLTEQYKSKAELLQRDIDALRVENAEYRTWLSRTKDAIPVIVPRINELKSRVAVLEEEGKTLRAQNPSAIQAQPEKTVNRGIAFIDDAMNLIVTLKEVSVDRTAQLRIKFPDKDVPIEQSVSPGQQWKFKFKNKGYKFTVTEISFVGDYVNFRVELDQ
jgi:exonuclease VII large subunit